MIIKKNELMNGDIVVLSSGCVAVVIGEGEYAYLMFQYGGVEFLDEYSVPPEHPFRSKWCMRSAMRGAVIPLSMVHGGRR